MNIADLIDQVTKNSASDLHVLVGSPPTLRVHGNLVSVPNTTPLDAKETMELALELMNAEQKKIFQEEKEIDFSYQFKDTGRFRVNAYMQRESAAFAMRLIPTQISSIDQLQLPQVVHDIVKLRQGLVLLTGPTGEGKSTSLAAMIDEINQTREEHIITIEDPIEFVHSPVRSIISQREIHQDTNGWGAALRSVLREDPDVVLIGEMRDLETISAALTIAETGHLVLATLHTNSASQTIDRIIDVYPENQQPQIRQQLAATIAAIFSQRLIPTRKEGRVAAVEVLIANLAVKNLIREGKTFQIDNVMQTGSELGMITMEASLANWVQTGVVSQEMAAMYTTRVGEFERLLAGK